MSEKDFDKGYKSGFKFGKEVANEEWLDKIKQAREEIEHLDGTTDDYNRNGEIIFRNMVDVDEVLEILDRLISEVEE